MSTQNTALTLKEILLGISDSLNEAQHQLRNAAPYDEYGRPNTLYTLPYLDFNLQVEAEFENITDTEYNYGTNKTVGKLATTETYQAAQSYLPALSFRPVNKKTLSKETNKITSTISGRFVAVMPNEGLPQLIIDAKPERTTTNGLYTINVEVFNSAGEKIPSALVEFNYDVNKANLLNPDTTLNHTTNFLKKGEILTDIEGKVKNQIQIDTTDYNSKSIIPILINVGTVSTQISIQKY